MKKFIYIILGMISLFLVMPSVHAKNDVKVYIFSKEGCPACEYAFEYFDGLLKNEPDLFELDVLEVFDGKWQTKNEELYNLLIKSLDHFGESTKPEDIATPIIAIGDYLQIGTKDLSKMYDRIVEFRDSEETPIDRISLIAKDINVNIDKLKVNRKQEQEKSSKYDLIILGTIFIVLIGGFALLIKVGKK